MAKVEEILGQERKVNLRDSIGNELKDGDFVTVLFNRPPIFKVVASELGGLMTPKGKTPSRVRLICDLTLTNQVGAEFGSVVKIVNPVSETLIGKILDTNKDPRKI